MEEQKQVSINVSKSEGAQQNQTNKEASDINPMRLSISELQDKIKSGQLQISPYKDVVDEKYEAMIYSPYKKTTASQDFQSSNAIEIVHEPKEKQEVQLLYTFGTTQREVFSVRFSPTDSKIAATYEDGQVQIYTVNEGIKSVSFDTSVTNFPASALRWKPYNFQHTKREILLVANTDGTITQYDLSNNQQVWKIEEPDNNIFALDYCREGKWFASGGKDKIVRVYDDEYKKKVCELKGLSWRKEGHTNRIFSLKFTDNPNTLLSCGWDGNLIIWDLRSERAVDVITGPQTSGDSIDFKNGQILAGSYRYKPSLQIYDLAQRSLLENIPWVKDDVTAETYVYACQFSKQKNNTILAGCSGKNEVKYFHQEKDFPPICTFKGLKKGCYSVDYANHSEMFAFGGADGLVYIAKPKN